MRIRSDRRCLKFASTLTALTFFFFFNDTATTEIYTLSLHDALPIYALRAALEASGHRFCTETDTETLAHLIEDVPAEIGRAQSELQSQSNLVCRLLLEKKKTNQGIDPNLAIIVSETDSSTEVSYLDC